MMVWIFFVFLLVGLLFYSVMFFLSNIFIASQQGLRLSPFEDNVKVENTNLCTDSDNGIYFKEKGKVLFQKRFFLFNWESQVEDRCNGATLTEYYCVNKENVVGMGLVDCEKSCIDGACV